MGEIKNGLAAESDSKPARIWDESTVMGIKGELFTLLMDLLHDISGHFKGERYIIEIDVSPEGVFVRKTAKE